MRQTLAAFVITAGLALAASPPNPAQFVSLTPDFNGVALAADGLNAWAAASNGMIYRSTNGGSTWKMVDVPGRGQLFGVHFHADGARGWAVGNGRILYTSDAGATWQNVPGVPEGKLRRVLFDAEGKRGFALGSTILSSEDGGRTWKQVRLEREGSRGFVSIAFAPDWSYGLIGGMYGVLESTDGGRTWVENTDQKFTGTIAKVWTDGRAAIAMSASNEMYWIRDPVARKWREAWDAHTGKAIQTFPPEVTTLAGELGLNMKFGIFLDGAGAKPLQRALAGKYRDLAFTPNPANAGLAVGERGLVARTDDRGRTWKLITQWQDFGDLEEVAFQPKAERMWAIGNKVWRSDDAGRSFHEVQVPDLAPGHHALAAFSRASASNIRFSPDGRLAWIASGGGAILRSTDGGDTWTKGEIDNERGNEIARIAFSPDGRRGIAVGYSGMFLTADGGATWKQTARPREAIDVCWADGRNAAVAISYEGKIWRSDDAGATWKNIPSGTSTDLFRIVFRNDGHLGWIAGYKFGGYEHPATILRTDTGGRTWSVARINADNVESITSLWFSPSGQYGWATAEVGHEGRFLRSLDYGKTWEIADGENQRSSSVAFSADGTRGWAASFSDLLASIHQADPPEIRKFGIDTNTYRLDLVASDPDTPAVDVQGIIEVESKGYPVAEENRKRSFSLADADLVDWPKDAFSSRENYIFHLRLSDGWNVVTRDYELGAPPAPSDVNNVPVRAAPVEISELRGQELTGTRILVDGKPVETSHIVTRGRDGAVALTPATELMQELPNGFHALAVLRGAGEIVQRIGFYKENLSVRLFRPYGDSYALMIAVSDYPASSGYSKLPNAVRQARELETTLRAQGFKVLPPLYDAKATRSGIEAAIQAAPAGPDDRLLVYFGGHGDDEKGFQGKPLGYLVPFDGNRKDLGRTAIPLERVAGEYSSRLRAKHVLFALDSCQSGLAVARGSAFELSESELKRFKALAEIEALASEPGRTVLAAGTGGQDALDVSGGIFTAALTDGIRGKADADHNGVVDYYELFAYVWGRVNAEARHWIRKQQPSDYHLGNGRWVFVHE